MEVFDFNKLLICYFPDQNKWHVVFYKDSYAFLENETSL